MISDLTQMLQGVSDESPCGANLEYDPSYIMLDELIREVPLSQIGDSVYEGRDPQWQQLRDNCLELWKSTRDLRVAIYYSIAEMVLDGVEGFNQGLTLVKYLVVEHWDSLWPALDPDDNNDPLERFNIFSMISPEPGAYSDPVQFLAHFRNVKLVQGKTYSLRDYMIATGDLDVPDETVDLSLLKAEMMSVPVLEMQEYYNRVVECENLIQEITEEVNGKISDTYSLSFNSLLGALKILKGFYSQFNSTPESENTTDEVVNDTEEPGSVAGSGAGNGKRNMSNIQNIAEYTPKSRNEALMLLRKGAEYFNSEEPTSPVPFLVNRALRMAEMNFVDLIAEIVPDGVSRANEQLGVFQNLDTD